MYDMDSMKSTCIFPDHRPASLLFALALSICAALLLFVLVAIGGCGESSSARTLYVDDDVANGGNGSIERPFNSIQDAIDASEDRDTVRVWEGIYYENVVVNKSVDLVGNGSEITTVDGGGSGDAVLITADRVNMSGFNVTGNRFDGLYLGLTGNGSDGLYAGIRVESDNNHIFGNNCSNNRYGIYLVSSNNSTIRNNKCNSIHGIYLYRSDECTIEDNNCSANNDSGILLDSSNECTIENNTCSANDFFGIHILASSNCTITNNECSANNHFGIYLVSSGSSTITNSKLQNNNGGVSLYNSDECTIKNNYCENCTYGIYLEYSDDCTIMSNYCENNSHGISLSYSDDNTLTSNTCKNNNKGIRLKPSSGSTITNNTILENRFGIYLSSSSRDNTAHYNSIFNNTGYGINATNNEGHTIDAANNYWGAASGPYHPNRNPGGKGDNITDNVEFIPWLNTNGTLNWTLYAEKDSNESSDTLHFILMGLTIFLTGNAVILVYAAHGSEALRFHILRFLLPLYSRLNEKTIEKDIRQQNIRGRIFQRIKDEPGENFSSILAGVNAGSGTTVYHLSVLEREGYIRSAVSGRSKLFWPKKEFPGIESVALTDIGRKIIELLKSKGRVSRTDILGELGVSKSTLHEQITKLKDMGKITEERDGRSHYCSLGHTGNDTGN